MVRIYLDWNVMSQMKAGLHQELANILSDKKKFFLLYSTSHISDIASSGSNMDNQPLIESDLAFIGSLTDNYCVYNEAEKTVIYQREPRELYEDHTGLKDLIPGLDFENLFTNLGIDKELQQIVDLQLQSLKKVSVDPIFKQAFENPETREQMRKFLPGLEGKNSMMDVLNAFLNMFSRLNEQDDYKYLREMVQSGLKINKDKAFNIDDPYEMIEKAYKKINTAYPELPIEQNRISKWFSKLSNEYLKLDMHGYQQDKVSTGKGRKQTFRNTLEDAFHSTFATTCDFYITADERNKKKAERLYEKCQQNTIAFKPEEFVSYYNDYLHFGPVDAFRIIAVLLKEGEPLVSDIGERTYFSPFFIFDYFNKIYVCKDPSSENLFLVLSKTRPTNEKNTYPNELTNLIEALLSVFGIDEDKLGTFEMTEFCDGADYWPGRKWNLNSISAQLRILNGYVQLYLDYPTSRETNPHSV